MARALGLATLTVGLLAGMATLLLNSREDGSAAGPLARVVIPAVASDSVAPADPLVREVVVSIHLDIHEPAITGSGFTLVVIDASAHGPLPGPLDPPVTVSGTFSISPHPTDECEWTSIADTTVTVSYSQSQGSTPGLTFEFPGNPEWYYWVQCPGSPPPPPIRFPATIPGFGDVNESLAGWLSLIFGPSQVLNGVRIDTPAVGGAQNCLKREGLATASNLFGSGAIHVWITNPPCLIVQPHRPPIRWRRRRRRPRPALDARTIQLGTSEIQRNIIATRGLGLPPG